MRTYALRLALAGLIGFSNASYAADKEKDAVDQAIEAVSNGEVYDGNPTSRTQVSAPEDNRKEVPPSKSPPKKTFLSAEGTPNIAGGQVLFAEGDKKAEAAPPLNWNGVRGAALGALALGLIGMALGGPIGLLAGVLAGILLGAWAGKMSGGLFGRFRHR